MGLFLMKGFLRLICSRFLTPFPIPGPGSASVGSNPFAKSRARVLISCSKLRKNGVYDTLLEQLSRERGRLKEQVSSRLAEQAVNTRSRHALRALKKSSVLSLTDDRREDSKTVRDLKWSTNAEGIFSPNCVDKEDLNEVSIAREEVH